MSLERALRWSLVTVAIIGLATGIIAHIVDHPRLAHLAWTLATITVLLGLAASIVRDFLSGRVGVDAVALLSMATSRRRDRHMLPAKTGDALYHDHMVLRRGPHR